MNNMDGQSEFTNRDITIPLLISGGVFGLICLASCVVLALSQDFLNNVALPGLGLIEPTPTLIPTPTPIPCPKVPSGWVKIMDDKFTNNVNDWPVGRENDEYALVEIEVTDGVYRISDKAKQAFYSYRNLPMKVLKDFYLISTVRQVSGPVDNDYGIVFRELNWNQYSFAVNDSKGVLIYKHSSNEDEDWMTLYDAYSAGIRPGEPNELIVLGQGSHFSFCINQQFVTELDNADYSVGRLGVTTSLNKAGDEAVTEYYDFIVYAPEKQQILE